MDGKAWYTSKTLWANIIGGGVTLATAFGVNLGLDVAQQAELVAGVMVVINIILRFKTKEPIA